MRERQNRQAEDDEDCEQDQDIEEGDLVAARAELQEELRGVLLEEERSDEPSASSEEGMLYVLSGGEDSVMQVV